MSIKERKDVIIENILSQPTYLVESGAYQLVAKALNKLPVGTLSTFEVILRMGSLKVTKAHVVVETYKDDNSVRLFSNLSDAKSHVENYANEQRDENVYGWGVEIFEDTKIN